jgi:hypothetical protein
MKGPWKCRARTVIRPWKCRGGTVCGAGLGTTCDGLCGAPCGARERAAPPLDVGNPLAAESFWTVPTIRLIGWVARSGGYISRPRPDLGERPLPRPGAVTERFYAPLVQKAGGTWEPGLNNGPCMRLREGWRGAGDARRFRPRPSPPDGRPEEIVADGTWSFSR